MKHQSSLLVYRNRLLLLLGVVALCGGLVACSRMASKPAMPEPMVPVEVASQIEQSLSDMVRALSDPAILVAPQTDALAGETDAEAPPMVGCPLESTGAGDATDSDGDNYPVDDTRTFDCELLFLRGVGRLVLMDKDDTDPASGVKAEASATYGLSDIEGLTDVEGPGLSITKEVLLDVTRSDTAADHQYDIAYMGSVGITIPPVRTDAAGGYDVMLTGTFPTGSLGVQGGFMFSTKPIDCGALEEALQEECRQQAAEVESVEIQLTVRTSGLEYDAAACATFTAGYFDVLDPAGNVLKSSYDGLRPGDRHLQRPAGSAARELSMSDRARRRGAWRGIAGIAAGPLGLGPAPCPSNTRTLPAGILTSAS